MAGRLDSPKHGGGGGWYPKDSALDGRNYWEIDLAEPQIIVGSRIQCTNYHWCIKHYKVQVSMDGGYDGTWVKVDSDFIMMGNAHGNSYGYSDKIDAIYAKNYYARFIRFTPTLCHNSCAARFAVLAIPPNDSPLPSPTDNANRWSETSICARNSLTPTPTPKPSSLSEQLQSRVYRRIGFSAKYVRGNNIMIGFNFNEQKLSWREINFAVFVVSNKIELHINGALQTVPCERSLCNIKVGDTFSIVQNIYGKFEIRVNNVLWYTHPYKINAGSIHGQYWFLDMVIHDAYAELENIRWVLEPNGQKPGRWQEINCCNGVWGSAGDLVVLKEVGQWLQSNYAGHLKKISNTGWHEGNGLERKSSAVSRGNMAERIASPRQQLRQYVGMEYTTMKDGHSVAAGLDHREESPRSDTEVYKENQFNSFINVHSFETYECAATKYRNPRSCDHRIPKVASGRWQVSGQG
jgi:hypothetical protein